EEYEHCVEKIIGVHHAREAVSFVFGEQIPDRHTALARCGHDLLGLGIADAGIVSARDDKQRRLDLLRVVDRRYPGEKFTHGGVALVAVFDAAEIASIALGALEER